MVKLVTYVITSIAIVLLFWALSGASLWSVIVGFLLLPFFCCLKG